MKIIRPVILLLLTIGLLIGEMPFGALKSPATAIPIAHAGEDEPANIFITFNLPDGSGSKVGRFSEDNVDDFDSVQVSGLEQGEKLTAIDRSSTSLIAVSNLGNFYSIDPETGIATKKGKLPSVLTNPNIGFDIDSVLKEARSVANEVDQNAIFDAETGQLKDVHSKLRYKPGDANENQPPNLNGIAYAVGANNVRTLYGIDSVLDVVVKIVNPAFGMIETIGSLGVTTTENIGFDISEDGKAFASLTDPNNPEVSKLYSIDLQTGRATERGTIESSGSVTGFTLGEKIRSDPPPASACLIDPAEARVPVGGTHFFKVKFTGDFTQLIDGVFGIISGPNAGELSVDDSGDEILVDYKGTEPGIDVIEFLGSPAIGPPFSCRATVEWVTDGPVIGSVRIMGKDLRINGTNFLSGTEVNLNGVDQKIKIKNSRVIIVKKASKHLKQCIGGTSLPNVIKVFRREAPLQPVTDTSAFATCP